MDTTSTFAFLDVIILLAGGYVFYAWYLLQFKNEAKEGLLVTKGTRTRMCKDFPAYKKYMANKTLVFAAVCVLSGVLGLLQDYGWKIGQIAYWIIFAVFFVVVCWYGRCAKKAQHKYFGNV